jgi:large-conductance mechanosensitive channel
MKIDWNLAVTIFTAFGVFEVVKKLIFYYLDNNVIKRNIEIREIAERFMNCCVQLKESGFRQDLTKEQYDQTTRDIAKFRSFNDEVSTSMAWLIIAPTVFTVEKTIKHFQPLDKQQADAYTNSLIDTANTIIEKCNKYRFQPIIKLHLPKKIISLYSKYVRRKKAQDKS